MSEITYTQENQIEIETARKIFEIIKMVQDYNIKDFTDLPEIRKTYVYLEKGYPLSDWNRRRIDNAHLFLTNCVADLPEPDFPFENTNQMEYQRGRADAFELALNNKTFRTLLRNQWDKEEGIPPEKKQESGFSAFGPE